MSTFGLNRFGDSFEKQIIYMKLLSFLPGGFNWYKKKINVFEVNEDDAVDH